MNLLRILFVLTCIINISISEYIYNPGYHTITSCGETENCFIICDYINSCSFSTFEVFNNNITIVCSGDDSCNELEIFASNVSSLDLTFSGDQAFSWGELFIDSLSSNIDITCNGFQGCYWSSFHYNTQSHITHNCNGDLSCANSVIHSIDNVNITVYCDGEISLYPCTRMVVLLPTVINTGYANIIAIGDVAANASTKELATYYPMYILSIYSIDPYSISCKNGYNCSLDNIWILYGIEFNINNSCKASNKECIQTQNQQIQTNNNNNDIIIIDSYFIDAFIDLDLSDHILSNDVLLIVWGRHLYNITVPTIINKESSLSFLCFPCILMNIYLETAQNAIITSFWGWFDKSCYYIYIYILACIVVFV